jgi:uncharacterized protein
MRLSQYTVVVVRDSDDNAILFNGCTGAIDIVNRKISDLLQECDHNETLLKDNIYGSLRNHLINRGHIVKKNNNQKIIVRRVGRRLHERNQKLSGFFIVPTYSCQKRCYYCCQQNRWSFASRDSETRMSLSMVDAAFSTIKTLNTNGIKSLNIYGGEPFQSNNYNLIDHIVNWSNKENFLLSVTTNGIESKNFSHMAGPKKISGICFSFSGSPKGNEWRRLIQNVETFLSRKVFVAIRINVDSSTINELEKFFTRIKEYSWFKNSQLTVNICPILPPHSSFLFNVLQPETYFSEVIHLLNDNIIPKNVEFDLSAGRQLSTILHKGFPSPPHPRHPAFCGSHQGNVLFDPEGHIYTCHNAVSNSSSSIGKYYPELNFDYESLFKHNAWIPDIAQICLLCPYVLLCGGGCNHRNALSPPGVNNLYCRWIDASFKLSLLSLSGSIPYVNHDNWL